MDSWWKFGAMNGLFGYNVILELQFLNVKVTRCPFRVDSYDSNNPPSIHSA
jgi:hypothetical protein